MQLPKARTADLLEQEADQELLIYDLRINKAYSLNETLKNVFSGCSKRQSFDELKRRYKYTDDLIHFALDELEANDLIEDYRSSYFIGLSRREIIKKVGLATMAALPVIVGLTAPPAAHAASTCGQSCNATNFSTVCPGRCSSCAGTGTCLGFPCTQIGTTCFQVDNGICTPATYACSVPNSIVPCTRENDPCFNMQNQFGQCVVSSSTCSSGGFSCNNPGGPCTRTRNDTCQGTGTCQ